MRLLIHAFIVMFGLALTACGPKPVQQVVLNTELGDIVVDVYGEKAPISAGDFLYYVDNHLYDGEGFYRAVRPETDPRQMGMELIQGGLLGLEPVTAMVDHETTEQTGLTHGDGAVSLARDEPGTGSAAYFFISIGDNAFLDYGGARNPDGQGYAVFGQVVKGMDVVRAIQARPTEGPSSNSATQGQYLSQPVKIVKARRR